MFRRMNETELAIRRIKDVRMIHIYELSRPKGNSSSEAGPCCPAIAVFFGNGRQLNLCADDEYFSLLTDKIFEIYQTDEHRDRIITDERTRRILGSGHLSDEDPFISSLGSLEDCTVPQSSALAKRFAPIVIWLLRELYSSIGREFTWTDTKTGWRGAGAVYGNVGARNAPRSGDEAQLFAFRVTELRSDLYSIRIGSFPEPMGTLTVRMSLEPDSVIFSYSADMHGINGISQYEFGTGFLAEMHSLYCDGEQIFTDNFRTANPLNPAGRKDRNRAADASSSEGQLGSTPGNKAADASSGDGQLGSTPGDKATDASSGDGQLGSTPGNKAADASSGDGQLSSILGENAVLLPEGLAPTAVYTLPFGMHYVLYRDRSGDSDTDRSENRSVFVYDEAGYAEIRRWIRVTDKRSGLTLKTRNKTFGRLLLRNGEVETALLD